MSNWKGYLAQVSSLAADWDTLGWVHFQKGNIDLAERYINAAWALEQHSEVGYHLGQIYQQRGKKEEAIHMYALATASDRLVPEARESLIRQVYPRRRETGSPGYCAKRCQLQFHLS
jgi:tetratricopeptide (TPR) repeat protein